MTEDFKKTSLIEPLADGGASRTMRDYKTYCEPWRAMRRHLRSDQSRVDCRQSRSSNVPIADDSRVNGDERVERVPLRTS